MLNRLHIGRGAAIALALLAGGCATKPLPSSQFEIRTAALRDQLIQLENSVNADEAGLLAKTAMDESAALAREYRPVQPAWFNNVLVNAGCRKRGLCYHWSNDLFPTLHKLALKSLDLHLAVTRMDTRHEHNCIIVTARNQSLEKGIVLDAWRRGGRLWFAPAAQDKYFWVPLPQDRVQPELKNLGTKPTQM